MPSRKWQVANALQVTTKSWPALCNTMRSAGKDPIRLEWPWELHAHVQASSVAPCCICSPLSSSMALKGATPVPGPTMIMGVPSGGRRITPGSIHTGACAITRSRAPDDWKDRSTSSSWKGSRRRCGQHDSAVMDNNNQRPEQQACAVLTFASGNPARRPASHALQTPRLCCLWGVW